MRFLRGVWRAFDDRSGCLDARPEHGLERDRARITHP